MKRIIVLVAAMALIAGCASVSKDVNLTGKWDYTYGAKNKTGSMNLIQNGYTMTGVAYDAEGKFNVRGTLKETKLTLFGINVDNAAKTFTANLELTSDNSFEGTYTNTLGQAGNMQGSRQTR